MIVSHASTSKWLKRQQGRVGEMEKEKADLQKKLDKSKTLVDRNESLKLELEQFQAASAAEHRGRQQVIAHQDAMIVELRDTIRGLRTEADLNSSHTTGIMMELDELKRQWNQQLLHVDRLGAQLRQKDMRIKELEALDMDAKKLRRRIQTAHEDAHKMAQELRLHGELTAEEYIRLALQKAAATGVDVEDLLRSLSGGTKTGRLSAKDQWVSNLPKDIEGNT